MPTSALSRETGIKRIESQMPLHLVTASLFVGVDYGYLAHYLIRRHESPGFAYLAAIVALICGAGAIGVCISGAGVGTSWYFIGLGIGFFLYWLALVFRSEKRRAGVSTPAERKLTLFPFLD